MLINNQQKSTINHFNTNKKVNKFKNCCGCLIINLVKIFVNDINYSQDDMSFFETIFMLLYSLASNSERMQTAKVLISKPVPRAVALKILNDSPDIAAEYIAHAKYIDNELLLGAITREEPEITTAIATREFLSEDVVLALMVTGCEKALNALEKNLTANIPSTLLRYEIDHNMQSIDSICFIKKNPEDKRIFHIDEFLSITSYEKRMIYLNSLQFDACKNRERIVDISALPTSIASSTEIFHWASIKDIESLANCISSSLGLLHDIAKKIIEDPGGEALVVVLAAMGISCSSVTGILLVLKYDQTRSYTNITALRILYRQITQQAAIAIVAHWGAQCTKNLDNHLRSKRKIIRPEELARRLA